MTMPNSEIRRSASGQRLPEWRVWDTGFVPVRERFSHYREGACETFMSLSPEKSYDNEFMARLEHLPLDNGAVNFVESVPHTIIRTTSDVAKMTDDLYHLNFQISGRSVYRIGGKEISISPKSCLLFKSTVPFCKVMDPQRRNILLSLVIPASSLSDVVSGASVGDCALVSDTLYGEFLQNSMGVMASRIHTATRLEVEALSGAVVDILRAAVCSMGARNQADKMPPFHEHGLYSLMVSHIRDNLQSPGLSPSSIAEAFGMSRRYVDIIFSRMGGGSASRFILHERLACARLDLINSRRNRLTVLEIAYRWGFEDASTFHRAFRAHYGETPGSLRKFD